MATTISAAVVGSTGLVGSQLLEQLLASPAVTNVGTLVRRAFPKPVNDPASKLHTAIEANNELWPSTLSAVLTKPSQSTAFFCALGTTKGAVGSVENQRKIDFELNYELAKSAHAAGVKTYVLISSYMADANSRSSAYLAMKGELETAVMDLGFEKCVLVRPGVILGSREKPRLGEMPLHAVAKAIGAVSPRLKGFLAQEDSIIAKAAIRAATEESVWEGRRIVEGKNGGKTWMMGMGEIVELGKQ